MDGIAGVVDILSMARRIDGNQSGAKITGTGDIGTGETVQAQGHVRKPRATKVDRFDLTQVSGPKLEGRKSEARIDPTDLPTTPDRAAMMGAEAGRWNAKGALLVSASTIEASRGKSGDDPYLRALAELAYSKDGPLSAIGAFGDLGVIGNNPMHPSFWIQAWTRALPAFARAVASNPFSPVGGDGPLGGLGAANQAAFEAALAPWLGTTAEEFEPGGLFGGIGNHSALGPESVLGPGGQLGGSGLSEDRNGNFRDAKGRVERDITVPGGQTTKRVELSELYSEARAEHMKNNDTSWMVINELKKVSDESSAIPFRSNHTQWVTLTAVPRRPGDTFELILETKDGRPIAVSDSEKMSNFIQVQVPEGQQLNVRVRLKKSEPIASAIWTDPVGQYVRAVLAPWVAWEEMLSPDQHPYALICNGSGEGTAGSDRAGPHQTTIDWDQINRGSK